MSLTRNLSNGHAIYLLIFGAFVFLLAVFFLRGSSPEASLTVKVVPVSSVPRCVDFTSSVDFDSEAYYRPIIENNLFRPLGWRPPRPKEPYRLIGTILPTDANKPPKAIIESTAGKTTHIVSIGEPLDASTEVVSIEGKAVTLETAGETRTLALESGLWLNPSVVSPRRSVSRSSVRNRRTVSPVRSSGSPRTEPPRGSDKLSSWETVEGEVIRLGDARLKNPAKWGLRRRLPDRSFDSKR